MFKKMQLNDFLSMDRRALEKTLIDFSNVKITPFNFLRVLRNLKEVVCMLGYTVASNHFHNINLSKSSVDVINAVSGVQEQIDILRQDIRNLYDE